MRSTKSFLWLLVFGLSPISLHAEVKYASFPALGIELPQLDGYVVSKQWLGLENPAKLVGIQITVMPDAPFSETSAGFTPQQMAAAHMKLHQRSETTIAGKKALMIHLTQPAQGIEVGKWIAIYGDEANTTMLVATFPPNDNEVSDEVKPILTGARAIEVKRRPLGENVDFKVGETGKLRLASDDNNSLMYTVGGKRTSESPSDPMFLVVKSGDVLPPGDIRGQLQQGLMHLAATTITQHDAIQNVDLGPDCRACEVTAAGEHQKTRTKRVIYERLIAYPDCSYLMVGIVGAKQGDEFLPEFKNMAEGFHRNSPIESRAVATSAPGRGPRGPGFSPRSFAVDDSARARSGRRHDTGAGDEATQARAVRARRVFKPGEPWEFYDIEDPRRDEAERAELAPGSAAESGRKRAARGRDSRNGESHTVIPAKPTKALPEFQYASDGINVSGEVGSRNGKQFSASAPNGGILVGMRVSRGDAFGGSVIGIAPIFQVKGRYVTGKLNGEGGDDGQVLLAPPGFAVGGVQVGSGLWMDALRLIYMPLEGNKLQVSNRQYSEWVGGRGGGTKELVSDGGLIVGVAGSSKENMESLQFLYVETEEVKAATSSTAESSGSSPDQELRTWKSASGKFTITARLQSVDGTQVKLVTQDGRHISVAIEKLSAEDQKRIKESEKEAENPFQVENSAGQPSK